MTLAEIVAARRSVRAFTPEPVPRGLIDDALALAVQSPAPHHSAPWRFSIVEEGAAKAALSSAMGDAWRADLEADGLTPQRIGAILERSHGLLTGAPTLVICSADLTRAHDYGDERRRLAEWSLFAHSVGAALQTFMLALAESGVSSCWLSAPVFCREVVREALGLPALVEPQALVLCGYADPGYVPRPRGEIDIHPYLVP